MASKESSQDLGEYQDGSKRRSSRNVALSTGLITQPVGGFADFLREKAIVGLAVGFVLGTQVQTVVKQLISSFIDPLFQLLLPGEKTLSSRTFTVHFDGRHADFGWGAIVYALLDFLFIAAAIYAIIKLFKLDRLDKPKS